MALVSSLCEAENYEVGSVWWSRLLMAVQKPWQQERNKQGHSTPLPGHVPMTRFLQLAPPLNISLSYDPISGLIHKCNHSL